MKVLIVDDEAFIRDGLRSQLNEMFPGKFEFCEAENGQIALELLGSVCPQIVLTDICMPDMDGLEFIEKAQTFGMNPHFIIISGHDNFSYARKAIKYNVADFLLKPIDEADLFQNFSVLLEAEETDNQQKKDEDKAVRFNQYLKQGIQTGFSVEGAQMYPEFQLSSIFPYSFFTVVAIPIKHFSIAWFQNQPLHIDDGSICLFEKSKGMCVCILSHRQRLSCFPKTIFYTLCQILQIDQDTSCGVSRLNHMQSTLSTACEEALSTVYLRIYGQMQVICFDHVSMQSIGILNPVECQRKIKAMLESGDFSGAETMMLQLYHNAKENCVNPREFMNACKHIFLQLEDSFENLNNVFRQTELPSYLMHFDYLCKFAACDEIARCLCDIIRNIADSVPAQNQSYSFLVGRMLRYVQDNISQAIELKKIAEDVDRGQNYLGAIFKKEVGVRFSDYVLQKKMEMAKSTIRQEPDIKIYELATRVGYVDEKYFAKIFKAYYGITPGQMKRAQKMRGAVSTEKRGFEMSKGDEYTK